MRRSDIKKGTIGVIAFSILFFVVISIVWLTRTPSDNKEDELTAETAGWSDTLTNKASDYDALRPMEREIERFMDRWNIRGMSIAVSRNDSLLYAKGLGWADKEAGKRMEANNIMRIASASKLITATAIMKLVEEGKVSLDSKVFGPDGILNRTDFTNAIRDKRMEDITVGQLLRHQGGFTLGAGDPMFNTKDIMAAKHLSKAPDNYELTKIVLGRRLGFSPGAGRRYSNFGYMLLSLVIEKLSGKSYWDYVYNSLLKPSGCTGFRPATNYYEERNPREVKYYAPDDERIEEFNGSGRMVTRAYGGANINGLMGAGGWCASAAELCRFVASIDNHPGIANVISSSSIDSMTAHSDKEKICLGWTDSDASGKWMRSGTLASAHALIERFPNGECWVITTNSGVWTGHHFTSEMNRLITRLRARYDSVFPKRNLF